MKSKHIPFRETEHKIIDKVTQERQLAETKFPLLFGLATTFGLVSTLYGFEKLIDANNWLSNNPWALLVLGLCTLIATGAAYRKLN